jgi:hypothetical protein
MSDPSCRLEPILKVELLGVWFFIPIFCVSGDTKFTVTLHINIYIRINVLETAVDGFWPLSAFQYMFGVIKK